MWSYEIYFFYNIENIVLHNLFFKSRNDASFWNGYASIICSTILQTLILFHNLMRRKFVFSFLPYLDSESNLARRPIRFRGRRLQPLNQVIPVSTATASTTAVLDILHGHLLRLVVVLLVLVAAVAGAAGRQHKGQRNPQDGQGGD